MLTYRSKSISQMLSELLTTKAWKDISDKSIRQCFRRVGFSKTDKENDLCDDIVIEELATEPSQLFDNLATCESSEQTILPEGQETEVEDCDTEFSNPIFAPAAKERSGTLSIGSRYRPIVICNKCFNFKLS